MYRNDTHTHAHLYAQTYAYMFIHTYMSRCTQMVAHDDADAGVDDARGQMVMMMPFSMMQ